MVNWEAMKALSEGKIVRRESWDSDQFLLKDENKLYILKGDEKIRAIGVQLLEFDTNDWIIAYQ